METISNKQLAEILVNETFNITQMDMEANKLKEVDKQKWVYLHCGFLAGLKVMGRSEKDCISIIKMAQRRIDNTFIKIEKLPKK